MSVTISSADPLPTAVTKLLVDKLYEKRKTAALDVEKIIKDLLSIGNQAEITKIVKYLSTNYVLSQNQNNKKGGLIGLAACAIALGKEASKYRSDLVPSVLSCFSDPDSRVRYYACEALYNIIKVLRASVLIYFNEIFDGLCKLCCDSDLNVRNGAELLDRLLKDIVTENSGNERFDVIVFMQLLRERIYVKNSYVRQFLVSWLKVLDSEPNINIAYHIADLLDGLFQILDDNNSEIKKMCENLLGDFLKEISNPQIEKVRYDAMLNIILIHCANTNDDSIQLTAMMWLKELISLWGDNSLTKMPGILNVILPCLSYGEDNLKKSIKELARSVNSTLWNLVDKASSSSSSSSSSPEASKSVESGETTVAKPSSKIEISKLIESLSRLMVTPTDPLTVVTTIESLKWIYHLVNRQPDLILDHVDEFFPILITFLSDPSKEAVELDLKILATISCSAYLINNKTTNEQDENLKQNFPKYNVYFIKFMTQLLELFRRDATLRHEKGSVIIKELCVLLNPEDIYRMFSNIIMNESDSEFALIMVDILNTILLTSTELYDLRNSLKDLNSQESNALFICLYKTWSHNPIATVALCLLSQNYEHAYNLVNLFGDIEITLNLLITIDKLVRLIESSIFAYLRLHLLDSEKNQFLVRALYGLLMILPQSEAFQMLKQRLDCVPNYYNKLATTVSTSTAAPLAAITSSSTVSSSSTTTSIDFSSLLTHFVQVQEKHKFFKRSKRIV